MPFRAARQCKHPGCWAAAMEGRFCAKHAGSVKATRPWDDRRGSSHSRGYDKAWRVIRLVALQRDHYECQSCKTREILTLATDVHHIVSIIDDPTLRLVLENLISLCHECHSSITATRDSTFARKRTQ